MERDARALTRAFTGAIAPPGRSRRPAAELILIPQPSLLVRRPRRVVHAAERDLYAPHIRDMGARRQNRPNRDVTHITARG
ncbi:hypothetical protein Lfu02_49870 [Longispora fulva]|uniref:Uncharacterized protein n=1 Tax=Longispora fulva TaxID=619741 RepID=A0A8J7GD53_9ACTN|nr:hypothetical protein [Longispora fulva]MBG6138363.1 hypothetical protein [Longispora fulva]GIG60615.1 hypothetical protein Lfu02_49870 [Longispora fulva]